MTTRKRADALREQRTLAERLRVWRQDRADAATRRNAERRKADLEAREGKRGADRVPQARRVTRPAPVQLVEHEHPNYRWRRNRSLYYGSGLATGQNRPHVNEHKDRTLPGKARRRARRAERAA